MGKPPHSAIISRYPTNRQGRPRQPLVVYRRQDLSPASVMVSRGHAPSLTLESIPCGRTPLTEVLT